MTRKATEITIRTLLRSANPLATDLLVVALESAEAPLRIGAARALVRREDPAGHRVLVERLAGLAPDVRDALSEAGPNSPMARSLGGMIVPGTPRLARRAAEAVRLLGVVSLAPRLVEAAEWSGEFGKVFAQDALKLAGVIEQAVRRYDPTVTRDGRPQPDPAFDRRAMLNALGPALERYGRHGHAELIEAFLLLTPADEPVLLRLLKSPKDPAYGPLLKALRTSHNRGVLKVLGAALVDPHAPTELIGLAAERFGVNDLTEMLSGLGERLGLRARENCRRIGAFAWLDPDRIGTLASLTDETQAIAIQLAASSAASRPRVVEAIRLVLSLGEKRGRLAAARAIETLPAHLALAPLREALTSGDPKVLATVIPMLRDKNFPDATTAMVPLLGHADQGVRRAAGRALSELSFMTYRDQRGKLTREERRRVGQLVDRADPMTRSVLRAEARSGATSRRLAALELIEEMGLADALTDTIVKLAEDQDSGVRGEAVRLLGVVTPSHRVLLALAKTSQDRTPAVQRLARSSYLRLGGDVALAMGAAEEGAA